MPSSFAAVPLAFPNDGSPSDMDVPLGIVYFLLIRISGYFRTWVYFEEGRPFRPCRRKNLARLNWRRASQDSQFVRRNRRGGNAASNLDTLS
jgi:hypothetical protein